MINRTIKSLLCIGVAALCLAGTLSAAKKKKDNPYKKIEKQKDPVTKKVYNFNGMNIIMGDWWTDPNAPAASKQQEDQRAFRQWVNESYNVNVLQKQFAGWERQPQAVANYCMSGADGKDYYVFCIDGRSANVGIRADLFYDLSKIKSINYHDESIYDQSVVTLLEKGNSFYAFNFGKPEPREGMFFNKRLLEEAGYDPDAPYDLQLKGEWTWEKFEEMCSKLTRDLDNDGVVDQYAMSNFYTCFTVAALASNNASKIGRDQNGKYYNNAGSDNSMEAFNWIQRMFATYQLPQSEGAAWDYFLTAFINGQTAFMCHQEYIAQPNGTLSSMQDDFGFVAFPLGPHSDGKYKTIRDTPMWIIPNIYDDATTEKIAKAVELWNGQVPGYEGPDAWKEGYYAGFRDSRAVDETIEILSKTPNPNYARLITGISDEDMCNSICWGWRTPMEEYEATQNVWQSLLDDINR